MLAGGGSINDTFLEAGLIDEIVRSRPLRRRPMSALGRSASSPARERRTSPCRRSGA